jgi:hypothetical protein
MQRFSYAQFFSFLSTCVILSHLACSFLSRLRPYWQKWKADVRNARDAREHNLLTLLFFLYFLSFDKVGRKKCKNDFFNPFFTCFILYKDGCDLFSSFLPSFLSFPTLSVDENSVEIPPNPLNPPETIERLPL